MALLNLKASSVPVTADQRQHTENHRKRIMNERELFMRERDDERKKNQWLQGELEAVQNSLDAVVSARGVTCPNCNWSNAAVVNSSGPGATAGQPPSSDETVKKLEVCQRFVSGLKRPTAQRQPRRTKKKCSQCNDGDNDICVGHTNTLSKSAQCRRNKENNLTRCVDLLQWAINELAKRLGERASLRRQLGDALRQLFSCCAHCGLRLASTPHVEQTAFSAASAPYAYSEPALTYPFGASQGPLQHVQSNTLENQGAVDHAYIAMHQPSPGAALTNRPLQPVAPAALGWHELELDWDIISEFLKEQQAGEPSTNRINPMPHYYVGLSYNQSAVDYAWSNLSSSDEAFSGVDELESLLSDIRLRTIDQVSAQRQDVANIDNEMLSLASDATSLTVQEFELNGPASLCSGKTDSSSKSGITSAVVQASDERDYLQVVDETEELSICRKQSRNDTIGDSPKSSVQNYTTSDSNVNRRFGSLSKGKNNLSAASFDPSTTYKNLANFGANGLPSKERLRSSAAIIGGPLSTLLEPRPTLKAERRLAEARGPFSSIDSNQVIVGVILLAVVVGIVLKWVTRRKGKERKNAVSKSRTMPNRCIPTYGSSQHEPLFPLATCTTRSHCVSDLNTDFRCENPVSSLPRVNPPFALASTTTSSPLSRLTGVPCNCLRATDTPRQHYCHMHTYGDHARPIGAYYDIDCRRESRFLCLKRSTHTDVHQ